jgi:hypothetical protein
VVDDNADMALAPGVRESMRVPPATYASLKATFRRVIKDFETDLTTRAGAVRGVVGIEGGVVSGC